MSDDRLRERRQFAAQRLIFAKQMADWKVRASVLGMTQRWLDLAELREEPDASDKALGLRAIQTKIGRELRAQYQLPQELPHGILTLLVQINAPQDRENSHPSWGKAPMEGNLRRRRYGSSPRKAGSWPARIGEAEPLTRPAAPVPGRLGFRAGVLVPD
jgi:hypothetical protein